MAENEAGVQTAALTDRRRETVGALLVLAVLAYCYRFGTLAYELVRPETNGFAFGAERERQAGISWVDFFKAFGQVAEPIVLVMLAVGVLFIVSRPWRAIGLVGRIALSFATVMSLILFFTGVFAAANVLIDDEGFAADFQYGAGRSLNSQIAAAAQPAVSAVVALYVTCVAVRVMFFEPRRARRAEAEAGWADAADVGVSVGVGPMAVGDGSVTVETSPAGPPPAGPPPAADGGWGPAPAPDVPARPRRPTPPEGAADQGDWARPPDT